MPTELHKSERFQGQRTRRDVLGMAAAWSAVGAFVMAMLGAMRLPMPSVFPESDSKVKLGPPDRFLPGSSTYFPKHRVWLFRDEAGYSALSAVCTHLGCIVERMESGEYLCPCHGSKFDSDGLVKGGPAPKGLVWLEMGLSPEGSLTVDTRTGAKVESRFVV